MNLAAIQLAQASRIGVIASPAVMRAGMARAGVHLQRKLDGMLSTSAARAGGRGLFRAATRAVALADAAARDTGTPGVGLAPALGFSSFGNLAGLHADAAETFAAFGDLAFGYDPSQFPNPPAPVVPGQAPPAAYTAANVNAWCDADFGPMTQTSGDGESAPARRARCGQQGGSFTDPPWTDKGRSQRMLLGKGQLTPQAYVDQWCDAKFGPKSQDSGIGNSTGARRARCGQNAGDFMWDPPWTPHGGDIRRLYVDDNVFTNVGNTIASGVNSVEDGVAAVGKAIGTAAGAVAAGAAAAWNAAKAGIQYINVFSAEGRKHLFDILCDVFMPPPIPLHYMLKRFPDLIGCLGSAHGADKLVCFATWLVNSIKDILSDPIFWICMNVLIGNIPGATVIALQVVCGALADLIKAKNLFGDQSKYVAAFVRMLGATGDLIFIVNLGTGAFTSPATYCILGAVLMQGSNDVPELGTVGQVMAENAVTISLVFSNIAAAAKKLAAWVSSSGDTSALNTLKSILGGIGSVLKTIGDGIAKIPLLGPIIADGIRALGSHLLELPALLGQAAVAAGNAAAAAAAATAKATQAAIDAAVAAARAAAEADYKKALNAALTAAKSASDAALAAAVAGTKAAGDAALAAAVAAARAAAVAGMYTKAALDAAVSAAVAAAKATAQAAQDAALAVAHADYQKALAAAVDAATAAAQKVAQATIAAAQAAAKVAQDAAAATAQALADALAKLKKFSVPPIGWNPKWPWPPESWPPSIDWPPKIDWPSFRPPGWPSLPECAWPPTQWPPAAACLPKVPAPPPPSCPPGLHVEGNACVFDPAVAASAQPAQAAVMDKGGIWHIILGAGAGMLLGGPPGAIAGGVAAANLLGGARVVPDAQEAI